MVEGSKQFYMWASKAFTHLRLEILCPLPYTACHLHRLDPTFPNCPLLTSSLQDLKTKTVPFLSEKHALHQHIHVRCTGLRSGDQSVHALQLGVSPPQTSSHRSDAHGSVR